MKIFQSHRKGLFVLLTLTLFSSIAVGLCNSEDNMKSSDLKNWPAGKSPNEIGMRIAEAFLRPPHRHYREEATKIPYRIVCTWLGGLWFSKASNNDALYQKFEDNIAPVFETKSHLQPPPGHVDNNIFGAIPLELYLQTKLSKHLDPGLMYADSQWDIPGDVTDDRKTFSENGYSWQTRLWVDDMFMITILQVQAYRATKKSKYINRAASQMILYLDELQLENGLFYHHPETPFSWGRGNGWVAVGMAELLYSLPEDHPTRSRIMSGYIKMMEALLKYQEPDGMWRQIIDDAESWKETSCTAMFTYSFIKGVKNGWLEEITYGIAARTGWLGLISYISVDDKLTDICQGTGRGDRDHYLQRKRVTGDGHGTAPLLWCAAALLQN